MGDIAADRITPSRRTDAASTRPATVSRVGAPIALAGIRHVAPERLSVQMLLQLQHTCGNAAIGDLFGARLSAVGPASVPVQRCGGELHEGCSCAVGVTPAAALDAGPTFDETRAAVQRDGPDAAVDKTAIPPDSPYAVAPAGLMNVFKVSYRNNTMLFRHGPDDTLVQVLDRIGMSAISIA